MAVAAAVGAVFIFDVVLQTGVVVIALALLWIAWELHRVASLAINFIGGFEESYLKRKQEIESGN